LVRKIIHSVVPEGLETTQNLNLSLLVGPDRFSYLVFTNKSILKLSVFEWQDELELLKAILKNIEADSIDLNKIETIYLSVFSADAKDYFSTDYSSNLKAIQFYFNSNFPSTETKDCFGSMLSAFYAIYPLKFTIFSYWQSGKLFLCSLSYGAVENKISREFRTAEDALYYVLHYYKQYNLSLELDALYLAGALSEDSAIFRLLYTYISKIDFVKNPSHLQLNTEEDLPYHLFFDILSATL
jgi:hypothetical protein